MFNMIKETTRKAELYNACIDSYEEINKIEEERYIEYLESLTELELQEELNKLDNQIEELKR